MGCRQWAVGRGNGHDLPGGRRGERRSPGNWAHEFWKPGALFIAKSKDGIRLSGAIRMKSDGQLRDEEGEGRTEDEHRGSEVNAVGEVVEPPSRDVPSDGNGHHGCEQDHDDEFARDQSDNSAGRCTQSYANPDFLSPFLGRVGSQANRPMQASRMATPAEMSVNVCTRCSSRYIFSNC